MKKILLSLFVIASLNAFSQSSGPLVLADGMIANSDFMKSQKSNIKGMKSYKAGVALPQALTAFSNALPSGITAISMKEDRYDKISLAELNNSYKLDAQNPVMVDGRLFTDTSVKILGDLLKSMELVMVDGKQLLAISSVIK